MKFNKYKPMIIILCALALPPLSEFIPPKYAVYFQLPLALALSVLFLIEKDSYLKYYNNLLRMIKREPKAQEDSEESVIEKPKIINEIQVLETTGFHLSASLLMMWLWAPPLAGIFALMESGEAARKAALFTSLSLLTAAAILYTFTVFVCMWFIKSRRSKDDYPFLLRPREKSFLIYMGMILLVMLLAYIYQRVFDTSLLTIFRDIVLSALALIIVSPLFLLLRLFLLYNVVWIKNWEDFLPVQSALKLKVFCKEHKIRPPIMGVLQDDAPVNAFTFGLGPFLSWVVVARGLKEALSVEELEAVYMHEFGHVGHWDFWAITGPAVILTSIFQVIVGASSLFQDSSGRLQGFMIIFSIFIINVAIYALKQLLSRTREYYADEFSAEGLHNPDHISRALAKITYGLAGSAYKQEVTQDDIEQAMLWDLKTLWARIMELGSTHPLTANRIRYMAVLSRLMERSVTFSYAASAVHRYFHFILDVIMEWVFSVSIVVSILFLISPQQKQLGMYLLIFGILIILSTLYKYPVLLFKFKEKAIRELIQDIKTSPMRGTPVTITGKLIGRRDPAARFCVHPVIEDQSGFVMTDYELLNLRLLPIPNTNYWLDYLNPFALYNLYLGWFKTPTWIEQEEVKITGWFRRVGSSGYLEIFKMSLPDGRTYRSYTLYFTLLLGAAVTIIGSVYMFLM